MNPLANRLAVRRPLTIACALLTLTLGLSMTQWSASASNSATAAAAATAPVPIKFTQANVLSGQKDWKFNEDVATVLGAEPDFVTYNEVPYRPAEALAPEGWQLHRGVGDRYKSATAVAWRTDKWSPLAAGTHRLSYRRGKAPGASVEWGIRYANWVTLINGRGEQISVISAHLPPQDKITEGLHVTAIQNLGVLARKLSVAGPVLVGGDFNMHYNGVDYERAALTANGFTPTFDVLGNHMPTGDHRGATIDYLFMHTAPQFQVRNHYTTELHSDHDALTAEMSFIPGTASGLPVFAKGPRKNSPSGNKAARRAVLDTMIDAIDNAPPNAGIHLATDKLTDKGAHGALKRANKRGVKVQFITRSARTNVKERRLIKKLGGRVKTRTFGVSCNKKCRSYDKRRGLPATTLLVSRAGASEAVRIESNQPVTSAATRQPTAARVWTNKTSYDYAFKVFLKQVQRRI